MIQSNQNEVRLSENQIMSSLKSPSTIEASQPFLTQQEEDQV